MPCPPPDAFSPAGRSEVVFHAKGQAPFEPRVVAGALITPEGDGIFVARAHAVEEAAVGAVTPRRPSDRFRQGVERDARARPPVAQAMEKTVGLGIGPPLPVVGLAVAGPPGSRDTAAIAVAARFF